MNKILALLLVFLLTPSLPEANAQDDDALGACDCVVNATGQRWCTETTRDWCSTYRKVGVVSCNWAIGSSCD
jgi:hypothetical protein